MVDPVSMAALTAMVGAVGSGMANEAGKRAYELLGGLAARIAGREVRAPCAPADWDALARLLHEGAERDPRHARSLAGMQALVGRALERPQALSCAPPFPSGVRSFTDRQEALRQLSREAFRPADGRPRRVLVHGPEGIGTSALAVQWCRAQSEQYPHGRLHVDLRGDGPGEGRDAATALRLLLGGLGLPPEDIPPALEERAGLFRRLTEDRRLCLVLDHAQSAAQVAPLLSGAAGVFTIVTAHRLLPGVDAVPVPVGPLTSRDATRLLTQVAGKEAVAAARAVLPSVLRRCAGRPYALLAAVPDLAAPPPPGETVGHRARRGGAAPEADPVHAVAVRAYERLGEDDARCYRLWALRPWPALTPAAAAAIAEVPETAAADLLDRLAERRLLERAGSGYRYRDGIRRHAEAQAARQDGLAACARTVHRAVAYYLDFAVHADLAALPERWHLGPRYRQATADRYPSRGAALAALKAELANLVQAVRAAEEFQDWASVSQLTEALWAVQLKAGRHDELLPALRIAARAAHERFPGTRMAGRMHTQLAFALLELRQFEEAEAQLRRAADAVRGAGHTQGVATAVESLGLLRLAQWRWQDALDCFTEAAAVLDGIAPGGEGFDDLPRARALLHRHRGRALRGLDRLPEALEESATALAHFRASGERYNAARTLTDLAETRLRAADPDGALPLIDEALAALESEQADHHVSHLRALRAQCADDGGVTRAG
ncbi:hypothetical protein GCM10018793_52140 [Streptomyces sulfonofaciens]|uniref:Tetratricopeptide repeat protein n=1 Tax=Streptomyces sulfonofaciens TaxID=68272 RepID=A0A919GIF8_9ACTN|nr:tetratricopeptide repeat protein [Streptomyces sulfonofaciens]GHH85174.1 hypothetical protein GCM10018793_52140 [Streptomyces sulfonofaciens]